MGSVEIYFIYRVLLMFYQSSDVEWGEVFQDRQPPGMADVEPAQGCASFGVS